MHLPSPLPMHDYNDYLACAAETLCCSDENFRTNALDYCQPYDVFIAMQVRRFCHDRLYSYCTANVISAIRIYKSIV